MYNPKNWYWIVANHPGVVFSSATGDYVNNNNATYLSWLGTGKQPTNISENDMLLLRIQRLEETQTLRRVREAAIGIDNGWLDDLNDKIDALRVQITA